MITEYLRTENVPLDRLIPFPGNAKRGRVDVIRESLRTNGQYRSLVVRLTPDDLMIVLAGNHTRLALIEEGSECARCEIIQCDDMTATKINLADNRTAELGAYDDAALADLLRALEDDYAGTGYQSDDIASVPDTEDLRMTEPGDADISEHVHEWSVVVTCSSEKDQAVLLDRLTGEGRTVRALMS